LHPVAKRVFLGYTLFYKILIIAKRSAERFKAKVRKITQRNRGESFKDIIDELNPLIRGWMNYFKLAACKELIKDLDSWIRRKLRCYRIKQCKRPYTLAKFLESRRISVEEAWKLALSGKGWWRKSNTPATSRAMGIKWFEKQGLLSLQKIYMSWWKENC
jgi:hypothetical protein